MISKFFLTFLAAFLAGQLVAAQSPTAFTYQGRLSDGSSSANGRYDLVFSLYDSATNGVRVGAAITNQSVSVGSGVFFSELDFGTAFSEIRWLEIGVRTNGSGTGFSLLAPRQKVTPSPAAISALVAASLQTDGSQPIELKIGGQRVFRLEQTGVSPNVLGGFFGNFISNGVVGASISGGVEPGHPNSVSASFGTIAGGAWNQAWDFGSVGGGYANQAFNFASVAGGSGNVAAPFGANGGGQNNAIGYNSFVGGGSLNQCTGQDSVIGGGTMNWATERFAFVGGGNGNQARAASVTIGGGDSNQANQTFATVSGGDHNRAFGIGSSVGGGQLNHALGPRSAISGGFDNSAAGSHAVVAGGGGNVGEGSYSAIPGGAENIARGAYSLAADRKGQANHDGAFVWADATDATFASTATNQFAIRASGGIVFYSDSNTNSGVTLMPGSGSWSSLSDVNAKTNLASVDTKAVLDKLAMLPIKSWSYRAQSSVRHIGPTAQEFFAAFGMGEDERHISTVDADGVSLAAIQALYVAFKENQQQLQAKNLEIAEIAGRLKRLERILEAKPPQ